MADYPKRNNEYWLQRLKKDGHHDLLTRIDAGSLTIYKATQVAGYRSQKPPSTAGKLSYHWERATAEERFRFVTAHLVDINRVVKEVAAELKRLKAEKPD